MEKIKKKFKSYIENEKSPPLRECRNFIPGKTDKQIQDKVRTIMRQLRRAK